MKRRQFIWTATFCVWGSAIPWLPSITSATQTKKKSSQTIEYQQHDLTCVHFPRSDANGLPGIKVIGIGVFGFEIVDRLIRKTHTGKETFFPAVIVIELIGTS